MGELVDLNAYRKKKQRQIEEEERKAAEEREYEIQEMQRILKGIMEEMGATQHTDGMFYVPLTDEEYYTHFQFDSGYNEDGYYESTWEWDGFDENYYFEPEQDED